MVCIQWKQLFMITLDYFSCSKWFMCFFIQYPMDLEAICLGSSCAEREQFYSLSKVDFLLIWFPLWYLPYFHLLIFIYNFKDF